MRDDLGVAGEVAALGVAADRCSGCVVSKDGRQVPFAEDQDAVGEFGSGGQDKSFGEAVLARTSRRILTMSMPAPARTASKAVVNWPARSRTRNRKVAARRRGRSAGCRPAAWSRLRLDGWSSPGCARSGCRLPGRREDVDPFQGDGAVDVEEVHGQHGRRLRAQEPPPGRVGRSQGAGGSPQPEDPADRECPNPVAEVCSSSPGRGSSRSGSPG